MASEWLRMILTMSTPFTEHRSWNSLPKVCKPRASGTGKLLVCSLHRDLEDSTQAKSLSLRWTVQNQGQDSAFIAEAERIRLDNVVILHVWLVSCYLCRNTTPLVSMHVYMPPTLGPLPFLLPPTGWHLALSGHNGMHSNPTQYWCTPVWLPLYVWLTQRSWGPSTYSRYSFHGKCFCWFSTNISSPLLCWNMLNHGLDFS